MHLIGYPWPAIGPSAPHGHPIDTLIPPTDNPRASQGTTLECSMANPCVLHRHSTDIPRVPGLPMDIPRTPRRHTTVPHGLLADVPRTPQITWTSHKHPMATLWTPITPSTTPRHPAPSPERPIDTPSTPQGHPHETPRTLPGHHAKLHEQLMRCSRIPHWMLADTKGRPRTSYERPTDNLTDTPQTPHDPPRTTHGHSMLRPINTSWTPTDTPRAPHAQLVGPLSMDTPRTPHGTTHGPCMGAP